ncbi:MAG TPA: transporter substrate-binding domain-containing protein [Alphaproteobacteria bacterium]
MAIFRFLIILFFLATATQAYAVDETAYERVAKSHTLRCGYFIWPPILVKDGNTGKISGASYELMGSLAKGLGLKVEWTMEVAPAEIATALNTKKIDAFCVPVFETPSRAMVMNFVGTLGYAALYPYVRPDDNRVKSIQNINDPKLKISVMEGEGASMLAHSMFDKAGFYELPQMSSASDLFVNVVTKKADIILSDVMTADGFIRNNPNSLKKATREAIGTFPFSFAVGQGETDLQIALNQALHIMVSTGELEHLYKKYGIAVDGIYTPAKPY